MSSERRRQPPLARDEHAEATAFLHEIVMTADSLREARAFDRELAMLFDPTSRVLRAIERCGGAPTFTDSVVCSACLGRARAAMLSRLHGKVSSSCSKRPTTAAPGRSR